MRQAVRARRRRGRRARSRGRRRRASSRCATSSSVTRPMRQLLREMVHDGTLGAVEHVQSTAPLGGFAHPLRPYGWLFDRALGGGWIGAWASHAVDSLRFAFGTEVVDVEALLRIDVTERPDDDGEMHACTAEDGLSATLVLDTGTTVASTAASRPSRTLPPRFTRVRSRAVVEIVADDAPRRSAAPTARSDRRRSRRTPTPIGTSSRCAGSPKSCATRSRAARSRPTRRPSPTAARATRSSISSAPPPSPVRSSPGRSHCGVPTPSNSQSTVRPALPHTPVHRSEVGGAFSDTAPRIRKTAFA